MANQAEKKNRKNYEDNIGIYWAIVLFFTVLKALGTAISLFKGTISFWDYFLFAGSG